MIKAQTLKGFRDFLPNEARKRQYVQNKLKDVFATFGFEPLETPALEYEEVLLGKYGEEGDKLMYRFTDNGGRRVALRYDQTVPLARVVAQYQNQLPIPFKRYQIQPVWRAENPQKGRFREFLQCDIDIVGSSSPLSDAEVIAVMSKSLKALGFENFKILINDRRIFEDISPNAIRIIDKLKKIGKNQVIKELTEKGLSLDILEKFEVAKPTENLLQVFSYLKKYNIAYEFSPTLARGLDYYTGMIFEVEIEDYTAGSVAGGGRYDNLIGLFSNTNIPATGVAYGFDRVLEAMEQFNLFPADLTSTRALVTIFNKELEQESLEAVSKLRSQNVNTEIWLDPETKLEKQLKYADQKGIPYVVIIGPNETEENKVTLKDLKNKTQKTIPLDKVINELTNS